MCVCVFVDTSVSIRLQWDSQFTVLPPEDMIKISFNSYLCFPSWSIPLHGSLEYA